MAAEMLTFGPEWLRALSSGGSVASPPSSPAMPKYKLAEYRYGREEMLALYVKDNKVPDEMQDREFSAILEEDPLQPLALVPLTEEEQRNFSRSVNSVAVLRLMGKGAGVAPAGVSRGRGSTRSRGRGRGESGFYQRSIEETDGGAFGRGGLREIHRSQSWDDRGDRRFEKPIRREGARAPFEEAAPSARKDFARSDSDNWRTLREEHEEEEEGAGGSGGAGTAGAGSGGSWRQSGASRRESERWRSASPDGGPRSAGWREHGGDGRRRKFDFDFRERDEEAPARGGGRRHRQSSESFEEEKDGLPEWCLEDETEEMGTFDSSGAFMSLKKGPKELHLEDQELSFQPLPEEQQEEEEEEEEEGQEEQLPEAQKGNPRASRELPVSPTAVAERDQKDPRPGPEEKKLPAPPGTPWQPSPPFGPLATPSAASDCESLGPGNSSKAEKLALLPSGNCEAEAGDGDPLGCPAQPGPAVLPPLPAAPSAAPAAEFTVGDNEDEDGMKHLQQEAEKMVASLQDSSLEEEHFGQDIADHRNTAAALPLSHEAAMKWFYKDPQGEIQGPFTTQEMAEWFQAGYFTMSLLVKRGCDEGFQPLGEVIKMWGRVPFAPGPSPPPLLGNMDQERLKKQQELAAAAIYQQLQHQQLLQLVNSRQYAQCALQQKASSGDLAQQQQLTTFLQQLQALKPRAGEQGLIPSMNRSISVPDTGSLWDTHTSASPQAGGEASLWDIPINSSTQGPILEQLQLQHKLQERRGAELRAKRDEDERKRREEEELYRRKQARLPSSSSWGQQSVNASSGQSSFSLADLQKLGDARTCRELREEFRHQEMLLKLLQQQQQQQQSTQPLWGGLAKQSPSLKALLELQQESERHLQKPAQPARAQQRAHGGHGLSSLPSQWASDVGSLWGSHDKAGPLGLWEESMKGPGPLARNLGLRNSRSSPSLGDAYSVSSRQSRKKTDEEEKLLKLLQGIHKPPQDGFTQWCEQMLHALNASSSLDGASGGGVFSSRAPFRMGGGLLAVPTVGAFLKEMESPYDVHDCIRSYLGDTLEAKEFAKQFLERRAKQRANQQRQQQQEASWLSSSSLQSLFQANHSPKPPSFENSQAVKIKRRPVMLHADPSILGYALHGASSELETVEDY
ncbi:GRB10-interacting GYF protein 1 isoform X2 [Crotalus tigris]|uniref:GRB10-interacting GYF protein 1 isoform X2 n=1 Tax=Crotalus tigris TaxID=88082 RepID=UPI00192F176B|nr:GRB10-interacting GYF protein 1 isoform X2 [Crotalus tigris]